MTMQTLGLEDLVRLIDDLRLAGYDIGTQKYINAQRLLLSLAAHGRHPARALDLLSLLAPVLCSSPREQESFYEYFPQWLARQPHLAHVGVEDFDARTRRDSGGAPKLRRKSVALRLLKRPPLIAAAVLLLAALASLSLFLILFRTLSGVVVNEDHTPVPDANITFTRQSGDTSSSVSTETDGKFAFTYRKKDAPTSLTIKHDGYNQQTLDLSNVQAPLTITLHRPTPTPTPNPTPENNRGSGAIPPPSRPTPTPASTPFATPTPAAFTINGKVSESGRGMSGVTVTLRSVTVMLNSGASVEAQTDANGSYSFNGVPAGESYTLFASKANYTFEPTNYPFDNLASNQTADFDATPLLVVNFALLRLVALALPLLLFALWWLWRLYRHRRMLLRKMRNAQPPRLEHLTVKGAAEQLFQGQAFRRVVQELRRHRRRISHDLDEQVTIEATIRRGGLFTPFYGSRKTLPEYLALIERLSARDQQARFQEELVRRLIEGSVIVDQYYFRGDPRICRKADAAAATRPAAFVTLPDLVALHPDYYLLIFSDGANFINPVTGEPESWLEQFAPWPGRALLTPESPAHWRSREWALQETDFLVLPAGREGLEALGEAVNTGTPPDLAGRRSARSRPFPELLRERPRRWLEEHEPPPDSVARLLEQLMAYLGADGMNWLAACAVYPALHWDLTLYLGFELTADRDEFERKLLSLVSLPWLRYGTMPDWLRARLVSALPPDAERTVRRALERLLITVLNPPSDGIRLDYSTRQKESTPRGLRGLWQTLRERLRTRKRRRTLRELLRTETDDSPLHDFVFLTFMSGRRPRRLDVSVPDLLRRLLFPRGLRPFGLRPATSLALAGVISLVGWQVVTRIYFRNEEVISSFIPTPTTTPTAPPTPTMNANAGGPVPPANNNKNANSSANSNNQPDNANNQTANINSSQPNNNQPVMNENSSTNQNSSRPLASEASEIDNKVKQILIDELGVKEAQVNPSARIIDDLGGDSLDAVELVMRLEEEFGIEILDEDCDKMRTVGDMYTYVRTHMAGHSGVTSNANTNTSVADSDADIVLPDSGKGFTTYNRAPGGANQYGLRSTIRAIKDLSAAWAAKQPGIRLQVGGIDRKVGITYHLHFPEYGHAFDLRPITNNGREETTDIRASNYSHELTRKLVLLIRQRFPGVLILFNDPVLVKEGLTKSASGYDQQLHVQLP